MSEHLHQQLNEHWRDAMLALCLTHTLTQHTPLQASALKNKEVTADDLYAYWLIDVQVSQAVPTSRVASAIASLQHYINALSLGLEPGYDLQGMSALQHTTWRDGLHAYAAWRTAQQLRHFPANYLNPSLRRDKTENFQQLENDIYQCRIQTDSVLPAIQRYLARFEEIATLKTLNGYIDGDKDRFANSVYYFIGKSNVDNTYYWRSLDMSRRCMRQATLDGQFYKQDAPQPDAWSAWKKIPLLASPNIPDHSVRPVYFNNRLFVVWAQCVSPTPSTYNTEYSWAQLGETEQDYKLRLQGFLKNNFIQFRLYYAYLKHDGSWSGPQVCSDEYCVMKELNRLSKEALMRATDTVAILDTSTTPASLFLGLNAHATPSQAVNNKIRSDFFQAIRINPDFYTERLFSRGTLLDLRPNAQHEKTARRYLSLFIYGNEHNFHFHAPVSETVAVPKGTNSAAVLDYPDWNYDGTQAYISDLTNLGDIVFNRTSSALEVTTRLDKAFPEHRTLEFKSRTSKAEFYLNLSTLHSPANNSEKLALQKGSELSITSDIGLPCRWVSLTVTCLKTGATYNNLIHKDKHDTSMGAQHLPLETDRNQSTVPLKDYYIEPDAFNFLFENTNTEYRIAVSFYTEQKATIPFESDWVFNTAIATLYARHYKPVIIIPRDENNLLPKKIHRANSYIVGEPKTSRREMNGTFSSLASTHTFSTHIQLDPTTLRPFEEHSNGTALARAITIIHGVLILDVNTRINDRLIRGYALKALSLTLPEQDAAPIRPLSPRISRRVSQPHGTAEFIDFSNSMIKLSDSRVADAQRAPIRLNTCVTQQLNSAASISLDQLFSMTASHWREPALVSHEPPTLLDFHGAYGHYFWELFLYLPWLVASRLNMEQRYAEAEAWLKYLFDPNSMPAQQPPAYWRLHALTPDQPELSYARNHPDDPNQLALSAPVYFRQALYRLYVDIQLNRGDAAYRQASADSLAEAKLWFMRVKSLLGPRPVSTLEEPWQPMTLEDLSASHSTSLRQRELQMGQQTAPGYPLCRAPASDPQHPFARDSSALCLPLDPGLVARWDTVDSRLFNLRHHLSISGKPLHLSLFAPALPAQLLLERLGSRNGITPSAALGSQLADIGHYRFQVVHAHAMSRVDNVIQLGQSLLSLFERKDQTELAQQLQQHVWELAQLGVEQQIQGMRIDEHNHKALLAGRRVIEGRMQYFEKRLQEGISTAESQASQQYLESARWELVASAAQAGAGLAMLIPNIFGTSNGGIRWEGAFHAIQAGAQGAANEKRASANHLERNEQFNRRAQEWAQALEQCRLELTQVDLQLETQAQQTAMLGLQLRQTEKAMLHARDTYELLNKRFTNEQLYQWFNSQLATFYYQAYDAAHALCLNAQACWQYERADWDTRFIQNSRWNNQFRGMSAGESLKLDLMKMHDAYLQRNQRDLEIRKTVSLRQLKGKDSTVTTHLDWSALHLELLKSGNVTFELTKALFDADYDHHYLRRIKSISVSLPATLGPYEDIRATLTQTWNQIQLTKSPSSTRENMRVREQVALSTGLNDNGLFTLNFDTDERYVPFEYTGAVSKWCLKFSKPDTQADMLKSLSDIIVHVHYTARSTGGQG
ncbi:neuraminidase-like domain-containing protein [Pseudomonas sp.]|uniref:Tc toxin subunit A-related protein n=1 Tax=Pseudomonas sp. TaxID=306 RepID=UPI0026334B48|nr:neuraminidase-like domain-containing protein [Pseudomonas sp.]